jgi:cytochrome c peroxidase
MPVRWLLLCGLVVGACADEAPPRASTKEELGALLFADPRLSEPAGQACMDCHDATAAFADPEDDRTSVGIVPGRFGLRNSQSVMYTAFVPPLHTDPLTGRPVGGLFWDGRASTLEQQVEGPLLNPLEMNNPDKATVVAKVKSAYGRELKSIFGKGALADTDTTFKHITEAIAAFERAPQFSPFSSKYDRVLAGRATLDKAEARGLAIFEDPARGNCASCHPSRPSADGKPPLFTTFAYENVGLPRFNDNPFYQLPETLNPGGPGVVDSGLAKTTGDPAHMGMFRVPTLRNVQRTTPYGHNGYYRRLDEMLAAMSPDASRPAAEVATTSRGHVAAAPLSRQDIADLIAFLATLTDAEVLATHN